MAVTEMDYLSGGGIDITPYIGQMIRYGMENQSGYAAIGTSVVGISKVKLTWYSSSSESSFTLFGVKADGTTEDIQTISANNTIVDVSDYIAIGGKRISAQAYWNVYIEG